MNRFLICQVHFVTFTLERFLICQVHFSPVCFNLFLICQVHLDPLYSNTVIEARSDLLSPIRKINQHVFQKLRMLEIRNIKNVLLAQVVLRCLLVPSFGASNLLAQPLVRR